MYIIIIMLNYKGSCVLSSCVLYTFLYTPELLGQFVIRLALCDVMFHLEMIEKVGHLDFNGRCTYILCFCKPPGSGVYSIYVYTPFTRIDNCSHW